MDTGFMRSVGKLGLYILLLTWAQTGQPHGRVVVDANNVVKNFYGVPLNLTVSGLKRLPFHVNVGYRMGESGREAIYTILAEENVEVKVQFDSGILYMAETASPNAVGPNCIGVGSSLSSVRAAWPNGKLVYGQEEGRFVTYITGTNVLYLFDPKDMPSDAFTGGRRDIEAPNMRVQKIRILRDTRP